MKNYNTHLLSIANLPGSWVAIALAIPSYIITLVGTEPWLQGLFYLSYLFLPWMQFRLKQPSSPLSLTFIIYGSLFLAAWIVPNLVTLNSGRLESEVLSLPVLTYHVLMLSFIVISLRSWVLGQKGGGYNDDRHFRTTLTLLLAPLAALILMETLRLYIELPGRRPDPFNYRHLNGEILLMFMLTSLALTSRGLKLLCLFIGFIALVLMQNRGGLIAAIIGIGVILGYKVMQKKSWIKILSCFLLFTLILVIFWHPILIILNDILLINDQNRGLGSGLTARIPIWLDAIERIGVHPLTGYGFFTHPYSFTHKEPLTFYHIHNLFIRIGFENGIVLLTLVIMTLGLTAVQIEKKQLHWERAVFYSILFYYFFIPRHLTLNPLSILLYIVIIKACCSPRVAKSLPTVKKKRARPKHTL